LRIHLHRHRHATIIATGINTDGKKTNANKTILKRFVRRKRTKKMTMFRPLGLDEYQVAADKAFFELLRCEKDYLRFTSAEGSGEHCVSGNRSLFHEQVFNWLDAHISR